MRKLTLLTLLLSALGVSAGNVSEPTAIWANWLIGKPGQDQATAVVTDGTDQVYWMFTDGSSSDDRDITYANQELYLGSLYDGTSSNKNLTLLKTNSEGEKQWCIYSEWGDFSPNEGGLAVKANGDIVFYTAVRHTDGYLTNPITLIDAKGRHTSVEWTIDDRRWEQLILGTVSPDGELKWIKTFSIDHSPVSGATGQWAEHTGDAINAYGVAVDNDNNIYICGNFRTDLTIPTPESGNIVLNPKNIEGWTGDSQSTVGSLFLIKLNEEGFYLNHLSENGEDIAASYLQKLVWRNNQLFAYGYLKGKNNATTEIAGIPFTPTDYINLMIGCFNADLEPQWLKCLPGNTVGGKNAVQNVGMSVNGSDLWLTGQYNGKISDPSDESLFVESTQGNMREGFIIRLDANDGSWIISANSRTSFPENYLTGYYDVICPVADPDNIYVYGYALNANVGVFLRSYDKATLTGNPEKSWNILTKGGVPTCQAIAYEATLGTAYIMARGNQAFQPLGGELTSNPGGYTNLLARFILPDSFTTGIINKEEYQNKNIRIETSKGTLLVSNAGDTVSELLVYDVTGKIIIRQSVAPESQLIFNLDPGIYIINGMKNIL